MSTDDEIPRPSPKPENQGESASQPAGGDERRRNRFRDERKPDASAHEANGGEYKPSGGSGAPPRRESSERRSGGGRERERERGPGSREQGRGPGGDAGRSRSGGGGRRSEPDSRRGGRPERGDSRDKRRSDDSAPKKESAAPAAKAAPEVSLSFLDELGGSLLESVSRSFSLTIKLLPPAMREPISAGYLIARALDTVADTAEVAAEKRLEHLRALLEMIKYGPDPELLQPLQKDLAAKQEHDGERDLIKQLPRCLAWLEALPPEDKWDLRRTLSRIGRGQELDLLRFGASDGTQPKALASETELSEYTYFVAGCVGELWTQLSQRYLPGKWSKLSADEMLKLGKHFGQGLQMVNILRDLPDDLADGRCYLPESLLAEQGLDTKTLLDEPAKAKPILDNLRKQTVEKLDDAWKYARALTPLKLRYACALPVLIGIETLGLLAKTSPLETSERLKVPKSGMRGLMLSSAIGTAVGPWHERQYRSARSRAVGRP